MTDLERELASDDAELRRHAVTRLVAQNPERRVAMLVGALGDADWRVRKEAVRVASEVGEKWGLLPDLVDALCQGDNVGLRNAALEVLELLGPRAANALLVALPRVPDTARKFLVTALGFAGGAGVDRLAQLSYDAEPNTAQAALEALARIGGARAEEALRGHLASEEPVQRLAALEGIERLEARVTLDALAPLLSDRLMRRLALRVLGFSDDPAAVDELVEGLTDASSANVTEAVLALGRLLMRDGALRDRIRGRASALQADALRALRGVAHGSTGDDARRDATWLLMLARDPESVGVAAELASDDRLPPAALGAIEAWGAAAVEPFLHAQGDLEPRPRAAALEIAADLAGASGASEGVVATLREALRSALRTSDPILQTAAARGLSGFGEGSDAAPLVETARTVDAARSAAGRALLRLAEREPEAVASALEGVQLDGPAGAALLPAVALACGDAAFDRLSEALNADDPRARRAALLALPRLGGERAAELAGFGLADEDIVVQTAAVAVLTQLGEEGHSVEHLRLALRAPSEPVAAGAARALGQLGDRVSIPPLRDVISEGRAGVAVAALEALRAMKDDALDELLVEALGRDDVELVKEALRAIAQSETPRRGSRMALALEHPAWDVRQLAASLLGEMGGEDVRSALKERADREEDVGVQAAIERALSASEEEAG